VSEQDSTSAELLNHVVQVLDDFPHLNQVSGDSGIAREEFDCGYGQRKSAPGTRPRALVNSFG
jgi:hypothetical protein